MTLTLCVCWCVHSWRGAVLCTYRASASTLSSFVTFSSCDVVFTQCWLCSAFALYFSTEETLQPRSAVVWCFHENKPCLWWSRGIMCNLCIIANFELQKVKKPTQLSTRPSSVLLAMKLIEPIYHCHFSTQCGVVTGSIVVRASNLQPRGHRFESRPRNNSGQVVHTHVPLFTK